MAELTSSKTIDLLKTLSSEAKEKISAAKLAVDVEQVRVSYFGKKGFISEVLASLKNFNAEARKEIGQVSNQVREELESLLSQKKAELETRELDQKLLKDQLDPTAPGVFYPRGELHPIRKVLREAVQIFEKAGLTPAYGPEVEYENYCFDKLNFKPGHAARDMQATFFVKNQGTERLVLRTHTSPVQVRILLKAAQNNFELPIRVQIPGRVYRVDDDSTHAPMFHQIEGLAVDRTATMGDLRAVLDYFFRNFFDEKTKIRFRPSFFPFTEPSAEVDASCVFCKGSGCKVCKQSGWLEVAGAGLVHPEVFDLCGWDSKSVQGWAFGLGIERLAMLKLGIPDLRLFFENRLSFLRAAQK
ncbi:MAG: Phenylalanine--tRNA ligase alpha subunit [Bacteriovoracaceae bacterium]|nr:Phenylalanine--tRNA ligase alpha subunit [Bacteriovoracaceae bacterium]